MFKRGGAPLKNHSLSPSERPDYVGERGTRGERFINKKYQAVIFDLGGTLVSLPDYGMAAREMASVLAVPAEEFVHLWFEHSEGLGTGVYPSYQSYIKHVCLKMGLDVPAHKLDSAAVFPFNVTKQIIMTPREGAIELLEYLKSNGYKTCLISDCAPDLPALWEGSPYAPYIDFAMFSCSAGMNKGDPRIFRTAVAELSVKPGECLYIADGYRNELANAARLGIHALQLLIPEEVDETNPLREDWNGPVISSLKEVLNLL